MACREYIFKFVSRSLLHIVFNPCSLLNPKKGAYEIPLTISQEGTQHEDYDAALHSTGKWALEAVEGAGNISLAEGLVFDSQGTLRFLDLGLLWPGEG